MTQDPNQIAVRKTKRSLWIFVGFAAMAHGVVGILFFTMSDHSESDSVSLSTLPLTFLEETVQSADKPGLETLQNKRKSLKKLKAKKLKHLSKSVEARKLVTDKKSINKFLASKQAVDHEEPGSKQKEIKKTELSEPSKKALAGTASQSPSRIKLSQQYFEHIREKLQASKYYPRRSQLRGVQGVVAVKFTLDNEGNLLTKTVAHENNELAELAKKSLLTATPFDAFAYEPRESGKGFKAHQFEVRLRFGD